MVLEFKIPKVRMRTRTAEQTALDVAFRKRMRSIRTTVGDKHEDDPDSGVVFLSNLPHAFCEYPMYKYFSQFGRIKRIRLSRSKKSAKSKGYAYIEFEYADVAKIVAQTMNNYLMYRKLIKCKVVPKDELHEDTFKGCFRQFGKPRGRMNSIRRNNSYAAGPDSERISRTLQRRARQESKKEKILKEMGIDLKIDGYKSEWNAVKTSLRKTRTKEIQNNEAVVEDDDDEEEVVDSREADSTGIEMSKEIEEPFSPDTGRKSRRRKKMSAEKDAPENVSPQEQDSAEVVDDKEIPGSTTEDVENSSKKRTKRTRRRIEAEDEKPSDAGETLETMAEENTEAEKTQASGKTVKKDKMTPKRRRRTPKK